MTRKNIIHKDEKRFLYKDPDFAQQNPGSGGILFGVLETKLEEPNPVTGPCLFQVVFNAQIVSRKQLEGIRDCILDALEGISEGRIMLAPPGTRIGNPTP